MSRKRETLHITLLFLAVLIAFMPMQAKTYLVCVGIADYPGKTNDLRISDNDAKSIAKVFAAADDAAAKILLNSKATKSVVLSALETTFANAKPTDTAILFFSGHGTPGALVCYDGLLGYQDIFNKFKMCAAQKKIIIADACFSGKMRITKQQVSTYKSQSVMLFLSSRTNEVSKESLYQNSLFTIYVERGLRGGADTNRDRTITALELYNFVHNGVTEASKNRQHPVMWGKFDNNMTIIKW